MIADNIGANINVFELLFSDFNLFYMIIFGSWNHHVYRLNDAHIENRKIALKSIKDVYNTKISTKIRNGIYQSIYYYIFYIIFAILVIYFFIHATGLSKKNFFIKSRVFNQFKYMGRWLG
jgi:hypothetical protein